MDFGDIIMVATSIRPTAYLQANNEISQIDFEAFWQATKLCLGWVLARVTNCTCLFVFSWRMLDVFSSRRTLGLLYQLYGYRWELARKDGPFCLVG